MASLSNLDGAVCFTCGNAAQALREAGVPVLEVGPRGVLQPNRWWSPEEISLAFPRLYDATSGHLDEECMKPLAYAFRQLLVEDLVGLEVVVEVPTGSGETLVALARAFPHVRFLAQYDQRRPETQFHPEAALNTQVVRLAHGVEVLGAVTADGPDYMCPWPSCLTHYPPEVTP